MKLLSLFDEEKEDELQSRQIRLQDAALKGRVSFLLQILQEEPLILNYTTMSSSMSDTLLNTSVLLGHLEFTKALLKQKPELAKLLNSHGSSALHLASAKGYVEIVKELLLVNPDMCFVLNHDGRSPLHLAAIKGRMAVLTQLIQTRPEAARVLTTEGESCLHLCVNCNKLDTLKMLVERLKKDEQIVNWKDQNGNTILHLAVAKKQIEIVKFLLSNTEIEVHARNVDGLTAMEILSQSPGDLRDMDIKECLQHGRASRIEHTPSILLETNINRTTSIGHPQNQQKSSNIKQSNNKQKPIDWLGRKRSALMIVASLLATVAFQAGLSPPGGVWQDDLLVDSNGSKPEKPHYVGQSVMAANLPQAYGQFMIFNTISFLASLSIILVQVSGLPLKRRRWMWAQMVTMWIAITAQTITYFITLVNMTPDRREGTLYQVTTISVIVWLSLMGVVFIGNVIRVLLYLLRKYGYIEEKEREPQIYGEG